MLKQKYFKITAGNKFQAVITFLRKELGWKPQDSLVRRSKGGRLGLWLRLCIKDFQADPLRSLRSSSTSTPLSAQLQTTRSGTCTRWVGWGACVDSGGGM